MHHAKCSDATTTSTWQHAQQQQHQQPHRHRQRKSQGVTHKGAKLYDAHRIFQPTGSCMNRQRALVVGLCVVGAVLPALGPPEGAACELAWQLRGARSAHEASWQSAPAPVVTALSGDGSADVLVASLRPPRIELFRYSSADAVASAAVDAQGGAAWASLQLIRRVSLSPAALTLSAGQWGRQPVSVHVSEPALTHGDEAAAKVRGSTRADGDPPLSAFCECWGAAAQVVVVVTEDWSILCFDAALNLLWEVSALNYGDRHGRSGTHLYFRCVDVVRCVAATSRRVASLPAALWCRRDLSVGVIPAPVASSTDGVVVVAGSVASVHAARRLASRANVLRHAYDAATLPSAVDALQRDPRDVFNAVVTSGGVHGDDGDHGVAAGAAADEDVNRHFSWYAVDVRSGRMLWRHESDDAATPTPRATEGANATVTMARAVLSATPHARADAAGTPLHVAVPHTLGRPGVVSSRLEQVAKARATAARMWCPHALSSCLH